MSVMASMIPVLSMNPDTLTKMMTKAGISTETKYKSLRSPVSRANFRSAFKKNLSEIFKENDVLSQLNVALALPKVEKKA